MNDNVSPWGQTHEERIDELEAYVERLDAQIAALKAERDTLKSDNGEYHGVINDAHRWCDLAGVNGGPLLARLQLVTQHIALLVAQTSELRAERDAAEDRVRVLEEQLSETHRKIANQRDANRRLTEDAHRRNAELAAMKSVAHTEARNWTLTANRLIAARQSRARLVRLVRVLRAELTSAWGIEEQAEQELNAAMTARDVALSARDEIEGLYEGMQWERDQYITKATYWRQKAESEQKGTEVAYELWDAAQAERDAARAWAAAWKRAAKRWQNELLTPRTVTFRVEKDLSQSSIDRRSQRRAERITSNRRAAEAMDRR